MGLFSRLSSVLLPCNKLSGIGTASRKRESPRISISGDRKSNTGQNGKTSCRFFCFVLPLSYRFRSLC